MKLYKIYPNVRNIFSVWKAYSWQTGVLLHKSRGGWRYSASLIEWGLELIKKCPIFWHRRRRKSEYLFCYPDFMLTVTTIMKTVIGAGIIGLPLTISKLGYLFGLFVYLLVVAINQFTSVMLLKSKNLSRHSNYSTIMRHLFNSKAAQAICSATILLNNLGNIWVHIRYLYRWTYHFQVSSSWNLCPGLTWCNRQVLRPIMVFYLGVGLFVNSIYAGSKDVKTQVYGLLGSRGNHRFYRLSHSYFLRWTGWE